MGVQFRKRTKGKTSWWNFSASESRGVGASHSSKLGKNTTINVGSGGRRRLTINLGNGFRYVKSKINIKPKDNVKRKVTKSAKLSSQEREDLLNFDVDACLRDIDGDPIIAKKQSFISLENVMAVFVMLGIPLIFIVLTGYFGISMMYTVPIAYVVYLSTLFISGGNDKFSIAMLPLLLIFTPIAWPAIIIIGSLTTLLYVFTH